MLRHRVTATTALCLFLAIVPVSGAGGVAQDGNGPDDRGTAATPRRVVAVGDIHGAIAEFVELLQVVELIDADLNWTGGDAILVQTGDFTDRGAGVRQVMDLLMRLRRQAPASGGEVLIAIGNHEVMNVIGEVRDVTPDIMLSFASADPVRTRDDGFKEFEKRVLSRDRRWSQLSRSQRRDVEDDWLSKHPVGHVEYLRALGPDGEYGQFLRSLPMSVIVQDVLFLHAGIPPELQEWGVERLNARVAEEIRAFDDYRRLLQDKERITSFANLTEIFGGAAGETDGLDWLEDRTASMASPPPLLGDLASVRDARQRFQSLFYLSDWFLNAPEGPLWFRGYARWGEAEGADLAADLVAALGVRAIVVGHTPQREGVRARFGSRIFLIDTGMLTERYGGEAMALEIVGETYTVIRATGQRTLLPAPPAVQPQSITRPPVER